MALTVPDIPWYDWRIYRTAYRARGAWWPSMGAISSLFILWLSFGVGDPLARFITTVWLGLVLLSCLLFGIALVGAAVRAVQALYQLGLFGWLRPRWWFEWGNLTWSLLALVLLIAGPLIALAPNIGLAPWGDALFGLAASSAMVLFWASMATAATGYAVSFITGRPRSGNAYACMQFAFPLTGGGVLITVAAVNWPPGNAQPHWLFLVIGAGGILILTLGVLDLVRTLNRDGARRHPADFD